MTTTATPAPTRVLAPALTPHAELALLARTLFRAGYDDQNLGHITYRQSDGTLLTTPYELGWDEVCASDIVRVDIDGAFIEGRWSAPSALALHLEFHRADPNCNVTVHQHPRYATIWSYTGRIPPPFDQRAAAIADEEISLYDDYEGPVDGRAAALAAVAGIGTAKCALLRSHGVFIVDASIVQAYNRCVNFEWRCRQAWFAEAIGATQLVPPHGQEAITAWITAARGVIPMMWEWAVRRELRADPAVLV